MQSTRYDQFNITYQSENNWTITGLNASESWHNHYLRRKGNKFYVGRKGESKIEYLISSSRMILTVYNYFIVVWNDEEEKKLLSIASKKGEFKAMSIKKALEINQTAIRQICLQMYWEDKH